MKSTGIVRKVDEVGRIVLPIELRCILGIDNRDSVEIFTEDDKIILKKYQPACVFCGSTKNVSVFKNKQVCARCIKDLSKLGENT
ncbi:MAG: AbrB family transcriptional regulator [Clostridia bacterium]|nr:AbrB family transcriptional regulator [Clostridia bacterium]